MYVRFLEGVRPRPSAQADMARSCLPYELFQNGKEALYYGLNALSNNLIMVDRKALKNPKGVYRKGTGTPRKQQAVRPQAAQGRGKGRAKVILTVVYHRQPNMERGLILCRH